MFQKNEIIYYGEQGICLIVDICQRKFQQQDQVRSYYVLHPMRKENVTIYVPTDNVSLTNRMRHTLSAKEIDELIKKVKTDKSEQIEWIDNCKDRYAKFQEIYKDADLYHLLKLSICLYSNRFSGYTRQDDLIFKQVRASLEKELMFCLGLTPSQVKLYAKNKLQ